MRYILELTEREKKWANISRRFSQKKSLGNEKLMMALFAFAIRINITFHMRFSFKTLLASTLNQYFTVERSVVVFVFGPTQDRSKEKGVRS